MVIKNLECVKMSTSTIQGGGSNKCDSYQPDYPKKYDKYDFCHPGYPKKYNSCDSGYPKKYNSCDYKAPTHCAYLTKILF